jgi:general secretion pathway protein L
VVLVSSQDVALAVLDLPAAARRDRLAALPFALEEHLAEPIEHLTFALGAEIAPRRHLAAAVSRSRMAAWTERLATLGFDHAMLVPDALSLPVPASGAWSVRQAKDHVLVRTSDSGGFAIAAGLLEVAWIAAGRPRVVAWGAPPPLPHAPAPDGPRPAAQLLPAPLDLRQGAFANKDLGLARPILRAAAIIAGALAIHGLIAAADGYALHRRAEARSAQALAALRRVSPAVPANADLAAEFDALFPAQPSTGGFLPLLSRTASALSASGEPISLRGLAYEGQSGALTLTIEAADLGVLQRVGNGVLRAGLPTTSGAASLEESRAVGELIVREPVS